jgi:hypothetical protein
MSTRYLCQSPSPFLRSDEGDRARTARTAIIMKGVGPMGGGSICMSMDTHTHKYTPAAHTHTHLRHVFARGSQTRVHHARECELYKRAGRRDAPRGVCEPVFELLHGVCEMDGAREARIGHSWARVGLASEVGQSIQGAVDLEAAAAVVREHDVPRKGLRENRTRGRGV